jgi:Flp pilus assembly protein TadD
LSRQGWNLVESNPSGAAEYFRRALQLRGGDADASYGLGYAMLKLHDRDGARQYLCQAIVTGDASTRREVSGLVKTNGLTCD